MQNNPETIRQAMKMAQSEAGQQLLRMLQQSGGTDLDQAMNRAASGDFSSAKALLTNLMKDPQAMELMKQIGGGYGATGR